VSTASYNTATTIIIQANSFGEQHCSRRAAHGDGPTAKRNGQNGGGDDNNIIMSPSEAESHGTDEKFRDSSGFPRKAERKNSAFCDSNGQETPGDLFQFIVADGL